MAVAMVMIPMVLEEVEKAVVVVARVVVVVAMVMVTLVRG